MRSNAGSLLVRNLGALLSRLRQADGDGLFPALYATASPALARAQSAVLHPAHSAPHALASRLSISGHEQLLSTLRIEDRFSRPLTMPPQQRRLFQTIALTLLLSTLA